MRRLAFPTALAALAIGALPALAHEGGLPELASLQVGPFLATVHNDAPTLVTGANTLTVEVPMLVAEAHTVGLILEGPRGERLEVPLRSVQVLGGPDDEHTGHAGLSAPATHVYEPGMSHDMPGMVHEAIPAGSPTFVARGSVSVPEPGDWQARLVVGQVGGERFAAEARLVAQDGGPSPLYLAGTGSVMGGFLLFGAVQRRRQSAAATGSIVAG